MASDTTSHSSPEVVVVTECSESRKIIKDLRQEKMVAVDAEGVNLGKNGKLTLLQIGVVSSKVFLFDVLTSKSLFDDGDLRGFLESSDGPVKVIHACSNDSSALHFQFNVTLRNMHDVQMADMVIEENNGRRLANRLKLADLCQKYNSSSLDSLEKKDDVKNKWMHEVWNYWEQRPLTSEMLTYASGDVLVLIPEVYENQCKILSANGLNEKFNERVQEEIMLNIHDSGHKKAMDRRDQAIKTILQSIPSRYPDGITFGNIEDPDTKEALKRVYYKQLGDYPKLVTTLKTECILTEFKEIRNEVRTAGDKYVPGRGLLGRLGALRQYPGSGIAYQAIELKHSITDILMKRIKKKYAPGTDLASLRAEEKDALRDMRPRSEHDTNYAPELLALYWQFRENELDLNFETHKKDSTQPFPEWQRKAMGFYANASVPRSLKRKANTYLSELDRLRSKASRRK